MKEIKCREMGIVVVVHLLRTVCVDKLDLERQYDLSQWGRDLLIVYKVYSYLWKVHILLYVFLQKEINSFENFFALVICILCVVTACFLSVVLCLGAVRSSVVHMKHCMF